MKKFYIEDSEEGNSVVFSDAQPVGFTEIADPTVLKPLIIGKYKEREVDGSEYFEGFRADIMLLVMQGTESSSDVVTLEQHLKPVTDELIIGNWITAGSINSGIALSGLYTQDMKDDIQSYIDNYITENY